ncbi:MAG: cytochrome c biogenesis protein CcdA [Methylococcales bacterium]|nr:cytochrome c biogenesis protein CcdA [Methylococcales bacterium]
MSQKLRLTLFLYLLFSGLFFIETSYAAPTMPLTLSPTTLTDWQQSIKVMIEVPKDHHAYLDKGTENAYIPLTLDPKQKLNALALNFEIDQQPSGVWEEAVKATVLRGKGIYRIKLSNSIGKFNTPQIPLELKYQLCNDITNVCYRPQVAKASLTTTLSSNEANEINEDKSWTEQISELFQHHKNNTLIIFGLMLLAGLLSVATPCVYPMLPITSLFIANRGGEQKGQNIKHAFIYMVGIINTYMLLGLLAGLSGGAFNSIMQSAYVNLAFAGFFAFFGIALLGVIEFQFMQNGVNQLDQKTAQVKGVFGTWLMGAVAGLVISPCVGPIVFAVLLQVSDNIAELSQTLEASGHVVTVMDKLALAWQGSLMMAGFGVGVGFPFFLTGMIKFKLPKAGTWMNKIKYGFGLVILYFAYTYFAKGLGIMGTPDNSILALALGMIAVWFAIMHANILAPLSDGASQNHRFHRFCGVISILIGTWLIISHLQQIPLLTPTKIVTATASIPTNTTKTIEMKAGIAWYRDYKVAQIASQETGKPIFIDFYASWCANCIAFSKKTETDLHLNQVLREEVIALKLVDKEPEFERFRHDPKYRALKIGLPYFAVLSKAGDKCWSGTDYQATETMITAIRTCSIHV